MPELSEKNEPNEGETITKNGVSFQQMRFKQYPFPEDAPAASAQYALVRETDLDTKIKGEAVTQSEVKSYFRTLRDKSQQAKCIHKTMAESNKHGSGGLLGDKKYNAQRSALLQPPIFEETVARKKASKDGGDKAFESVITSQYSKFLGNNTND